MWNIYRNIIIHTEEVKMLPRRGAITRIATIAAFVSVGLWLYVMTPSNVRPVNNDNLPSNLAVLPTRSNTVLNKSNHVPELDSRNETLQNMMKNLTLRKADHKEIQHIVNHIQGNLSYSIIDQTKHVNPHAFRYIINNENMCKDKDVFVIVYIHTAPSHYKRRMVIRDTWGNPKYYPDTTMKLIFVMGVNYDKPELQPALQFEAEQYSDIVQEDFVDSYKNLTYKGVAALKWITKYCSQAKFVLKTDDDIFVNMFTMLRHLHSLDNVGIDNNKIILCLVWNSMKVMREGKWKVNESEFAAKTYPTYCSGSAFTMSTDVAIALHNISYYVPFFWVDDFYVTGLLPLKHGGFKHKSIGSTYVLDGRKLEEKFTGPQWFTYIFSHIHNLNKIQSVWKKLVDLATGVAPPPEIRYALPGHIPPPTKAPTKKPEEKKQ